MEFLDATDHLNIRVGPDILSTSPRLRRGRIAFRQPFGLLRRIMIKRRRGLGATRRLDTAVGAVNTSPTHGAVAKASFEFGRAVRRTSVTQGGWASAMFPFWWVLSKIAHSNPAALENVTGMAVLRWMPEDDDEYGEPIIWQTTSTGMPDPRGTEFPLG